MFVIERQSAAEQCVQNDSTRPDVYFRAGIELSTNDFGGSIIGTAA
jgi:hypothetical protein